MPSKESAQTSSPNQFHKLQDQIDSTLLLQRRIIISSGIDSEIAERIIKELMFLDIQDPQKPILLIINSPGGSVDAGFAIWDQIKLISAPVTTIVMGIAASMGSVLSLAAPKGRRFATPKCRIMIHQPSLAGVVQGQATDLEIQAREMLKTKARLVDIYVEATGKSPEVIEKAIDRDTWMSAEEAMEYGLIDKIVSSANELTV